MFLCALFSHSCCAMYQELIAETSPEACFLLLQGRCTSPDTAEIVADFKCEQPSNQKALLEKHNIGQRKGYPRLIV